MPLQWGYCPVRKDARLGEHEGAAEKARRNSTPSAHSRIKLGVGTAWPQGSTKRPLLWLWKKRILGRVVACIARAPAFRIGVFFSSIKEIYGHIEADAPRSPRQKAASGSCSAERQYSLAISPDGHFRPPVPAPIWRGNFECVPGSDFTVQDSPRNAS